MYAQIVAALTELKNPQKARILQGFFKTGKGEYGEGDIFLGITVPEQRNVARQFRDASLEDVARLLASSIHEHRLTGLLILVDQFSRSDATVRDSIVTFYLQHLAYVNNWDLVDSSAHQILGTYLLDKDRKVLYRLARSSDLWEKRVAIVATYAFIRAGQFEDTLKISFVLLHDKHDLIHKAVGWMLREAGKKDILVLRGFLTKHSSIMPRTMLRYAIEKMSPLERKKWMGK